MGQISEYLAACFELTIDEIYVLYTKFEGQLK